MNEPDFLQQLIAEIHAQGMELPLAERYAVLIGDTPVMDEAGNVIVLDEHGTELARLRPLDIFKAE